MGVRRHQYGKEMDKSKKGESLQTRHKTAVKRSSVGTKRSPSKYAQLVKKTRRRLKELFYGENTYLPKKKKVEKVKAKVGPTTRTKVVGKQLKTAGLSASDIAKLRGKK